MNANLLILQGPFPDISDEFTTSELFPNRDALLAHVREIARRRNIHLVIEHSKNRSGNKLAYAMIICHFGGYHRPGRSKNIRKTSSKKRECTFRLYAKERRDDGLWGYVVRNGTHNHGFPLYPEGFPLGKLTGVEYDAVCNASESSLRPNNIVAMLKMYDEKNVSTPMHVRNAITKYREKERQGRTPLQQFLKLLKDHQYTYYTREDAESGMIGDIFFSHPLAMKMLNCFPYVVQGDCTYNTNF